MSEEEALSLVDTVADPCTEVFVIEFASPRLVPFLHQSLHVLEVDPLGVAEIPQDVFYGDQPIIILIQEEKSFPDRCEITAELLFELSFNLLDVLEAA